MFGLEAFFYPCTYPESLPSMPRAVGRMLRFHLAVILVLRKVSSILGGMNKIGGAPPKY